MINSIIERRMAEVKISMIVIIMLSALYILLFGVDTMQERLGSIVASFIIAFITFGGVYFILWIQVRNPLCSKNLLNFGCNFFIYSSLLALIIILISLVIYRQAINITGISAVEGTMLSTILIKRKHILNCR